MANNTKPDDLSNPKTEGDMFVWQKQGKSLALFHSDYEAPLLRLFPDDIDPNIWRIKMARGFISNAGSLNEIKQSALLLAVPLLACRKEVVDAD